MIGLVAPSVAYQGELGQVHEEQQRRAGPGGDLEARAGEERDADAEQADHEQPVGPRACDVREELGERVVALCAAFMKPCAGVPPLIQACADGVA